METITVEQYKKDIGALLTEMSPRNVRKAVRNAERRIGEKIRKDAVARLRATGLRVDKNLEEGVRLVRFSKRFGFAVTIKPNRATGESYHKNRQGLLKPVLAWAESGTDDRKTRKGGKNRGRMDKNKSYSFMPSEENYVDFVESNMMTAIDQECNKIVSKYGLI